ncbi:glycosyltransferase [Bacillus tianshenii]|nr:glycosyltransferase [Bacillus tianshenii]
MRVFIVPSWYPIKSKPIRGVFFQEQAQALQRHGMDVTVLYTDMWSIKRLGKYKEGKGVVFNREGILNTFRYNGYNYFLGVPYVPYFIRYLRLKKIYSLAVQTYGKPDIIHAHACNWAGIVAAKLAKEENIPFVITEHSSSIGRKSLNPYQEKLITKAFKSTGKLIAVSPTLKKDMRRITNGVPIDVIPNIVNVDVFKREDNTNLKTQNSPFRFLSVAFLTYNKGMDLLIRAFATAFKGENVELVIGGDGKERIKLENLVNELDMHNQIIFLGSLSREQVIQQMGQCHAFVLASRYETFGIVYIEALACGKPIIATACGGPEMIVNETVGILVKNESVDELQNALTYLKDNFHLYDSEMIRKDCEARFSEKAVVKQIRQCYESLLSM